MAAPNGGSSIRAGDDGDKLTAPNLGERDGRDVLVVHGEVEPAIAKLWRPGRGYGTFDRGKFETGEFAFEFFPTCPIGAQVGGSKGGQQLLPDNVQHGLHILYAAGNGQNGVLLWKNEAELAESAVASIGIMAAAPELKAVSLFPIALWIRGILKLCR